MPEGPADGRTRGEAVTHGYGGYTLGCRCEHCVDAKRVYNRNWMRRYRARREWLVNGHRWGDRLDRREGPLVVCEAGTFIRMVEERRPLKGRRL